jgi:molybdate transport system regulatory protein
MEAAYNLKLTGKVWVENSEGKVIGPGRIELLERVQKCGSIRQAALQMSMSYRQAWQLIDHMNTQLQTPVVISHRGGKGGGHAEITVEGQKVIDQYNLINQKFRQFLIETGATLTLD